MEYIEPLKLIKITLEQDAIGNVITKEEDTDVLCRPNVVGTREFYNAMMVGLKPTAELQIRQCEYNGEEEVEYKGIRLAVIRTIPKGKFDVVLVVGQKQGVNANNT